MLGDFLRFRPSQPAERSVRPQHRCVGQRLQCQLCQLARIGRRRISMLRLGKVLCLGLKYIKMVSICFNMFKDGSTMFNPAQKYGQYSSRDWTWQYIETTPVLHQHQTYQSISERPERFAAASTSRCFRSFDDHRNSAQQCSCEATLAEALCVEATCCLCKRLGLGTHLPLQTLCEGNSKKNASRTEHSIGHSSQQTARAEGGKPRYSAAKVFSKHLTGIGNCCLSKKAVKLKHHHHSSEHQDECKIEAAALGGWQAFRIQSHKRNWPATSLETAIAIVPKCSQTSGSQWKPMRQQKDTTKIKRW